jgi:hypothetical protein
MNGCFFYKIYYCTKFIFLIGYCYLRLSTREGMQGFLFLHLGWGREPAEFSSSSQLSPWFAPVPAAGCPPALDCCGSPVDCCAALAGCCGLPADCFLVPTVLDEQYPAGKKIYIVHLISYYLTESRKIISIHARPWMKSG